MFEIILVALDGSETAEMVIPYAEEIAARLGSSSTLVSVSESAADTEHLYQAYLKRLTEQFENELWEWGAKGEAKARSEILFGKPADEILSCADKGNVDVIVMASRGLSGQGPWILGNIAAKVLRATTRPILLVRAPAKPQDIRQRRLFQKILVPLDGSKLGESAILYAEALGQELDAELVLFQVLEPLDKAWLSEPHTFYAMPPDIENRKSAAMNYLDGVGKSLKEMGLKAASAVAVGSPADQIIDYAKANAIDLIAMSTHGRTGIGRWVFGSVTDKVLHAGDTAVLVVRATKA